MVLVEVLSNLTRHNGITDIKNSFSKGLSASGFPLKVSTSTSPQYKQHSVVIHLTPLGQ